MIATSYGVLTGKQKKEKRSDKEKISRRTGKHFPAGKPDRKKNSTPENKHPQVRRGNIPLTSRGFPNQATEIISLQPPGPQILFPVSPPSLPHPPNPEWRTKMRRRT